MKIREQLLAFESALAPFAKASGGAAEIATDVFHLFALLSEKPGSFRAAILFHSELKRGEYEESGMVDRHFYVVVTRAKGMTLVPADSLVRGSAGSAPPLFDLIEAARDLVRNLSIVTDDADTEVTPNYLGCTPYVTPNGVLTDAMQLEFALGCQLPAAGDVDVLSDAAKNNITDAGDSNILA